ncbi:MAG: class I SAM-dependent methyltransferase, partial [Pirellulales bacterium]|nr:class I SAM-dependent methyltransferase [Pirellulales bacterium]
PDPKTFEQTVRERFDNDPSLEGRLQFLKQDSTTLSPEDVRRLVPGGFRLFSVDGGHLVDEAHHDLQLSSQLVTDDGIIIVDDIFNTTCPGVIEGTLRFLNSEAGRQFEAFCICGNKMFLARRAAAQHCRSMLLDLIEQHDDVSLFRDTKRFLRDLPPGVMPRFSGADVVVITWSGDYLVADDGVPVTLMTRVVDRSEVHSDLCVLPSPVTLCDRAAWKAA